MAISLSNAGAYNLQFVGAEPVFIDYLSFRRYRSGEFWRGHRQFCEQFLDPLLLDAYLGVAFNNWMRSSLGGITTVEMNRLLPIRRKWSWSWRVMQQGASRGDRLRLLGTDPPKNSHRPVIRAC